MASRPLADAHGSEDGANKLPPGQTDDRMIWPQAHGRSVENLPALIPLGGPQTWPDAHGRSLAFAALNCSSRRAG